MAPQWRRSTPSYRGLTPGLVSGLCFVISISTLFYVFLTLPLPGFHTSWGEGGVLSHVSLKHQSLKHELLEGSRGMPPQDL